MSSGKVASWAHGEEFVDEADLFADDGVLARARERGNELGAPPVLCVFLTAVEAEGDPQGSIAVFMLLILSAPSPRWRGG